MKRVAQGQSIVVMGVSGSGKSTIALALAAQINADFIDADWFHPADNLAKMSKGKALNDHDRLPWLHTVGQHMQQLSSIRRSSVTSCSALKRSYRDVLRTYVPDAIFILLDGPFEVIQARVEARHHDFMPSSLLASQFESLEPLNDDERGMTVDVEKSPDEIVNNIEDELRKLIIAIERDDEETR